MFYLPGTRSHSAFRSRDGRLRGRIVDEFDSEELRELLRSPDGFAARSGSELIKRHARSTVTRTRVGGVGVVIKENHAVSAAKALKRALLPSRAARAWYAAHMVEGLGIDTAAPVAYVERRYGPFRGRSWVVLVDLRGMDAQSYLLDTGIAPDEHARIVDAIAGIYATLHRANVTHGDNRPQNFIVVDGRPHIIDLDVAAVHPWWSFLKRRFMRRDLRRFVDRWHRHPEIAAEFRSAFERHGLVVQ